MTAPTILVVDDEEGIRYFLERFLTREGFQVVTVSSGEAALARLASTEFDVVLLDLKMKGIGGLDVLADLRQRWPATSVIILTAHASLESAVEALHRGAHDYLFKPCRTLDLRESIRAGLIKRREQLQTAPVNRQPDRTGTAHRSDQSPAPVRSVFAAQRSDRRSGPAHRHTRRRAAGTQPHRIRSLGLSGQ